MSPAKKILGVIFVFFLMAVSGGCAPMDSGGSRPNDAIPVGYKYYPKLPPGIENIEAAKKDLAELLKSRKQPGIKYYGQQDINNYAGKQALVGLMKDIHGGVWAYYDSSNELLFMAFDGLSVLPEHIEVSPRIAFFYADLIGAPIVVEKTVAEPPAFMTYIVEGTVGIGEVRLPYRVDFPGLMSFLFGDLTDAQRFADDLFFIQQNIEKDNKEQLALFESRAAQYRTLKVKPPVSEEQRRSIVQANALNQRKEYAGAIDLYSKVIDVDPVSFPPAYFNLALLCAQMQRFQPAIAYMKQYLLLVPDANDARAAQDKIYEWELK